MQRDEKLYKRTFPISWRLCVACDKETKLEVMYVYENFFGMKSHYCKKCHEIKLGRKS